MENLCKSIRFTRACYKHPKKVFVNDVIRRGGGGYVTDAAKQEYFKNNKVQAQVRGTFKAAVLEDHPD